MSMKITPYQANPVNSELAATTELVICAAAALAEDAG
jgi:hypothetical protein